MIKTMKICTKCKEEKKLIEFSKNKEKKDGLSTRCKDCNKKYYQDNKESKREYYQNNKEKIQIREKKYKEENKEVILEKYKQYYQDNKESKREYYQDNKEYYKQYYQDNKESWKAYQKNYQKNYNQDNKESKREYQREYYQKNKEYYKGYRKKYTKEKRVNDPLFKLSMNTRNLIRGSINSGGYKKTSKTATILGCSFDEFMIYLNDNRYGFKYGDIDLDLDHIIPLIYATTEEEILKLNHYTNFQLLPSEYNRNVKRGGIWDARDFEEWLKINYI